MATEQYTSNDLSFIAYTLMHGAKLLTAKQLGKTFRFTVETNGTSIHALKISFINSEAAKFDAAVRDLKKIMYSGSR